jgi:putative heme iron utilization protein
MSDEKWIEWRPTWADHILGKYTERVADEETGLPEAQRVVVECTQCKAIWKTWCSSGSVRQHIQRFAFLHTHKDPFEVPKVPST